MDNFILIANDIININSELNSKYIKTINEFEELKYYFVKHFLQLSSNNKLNSFELNENCDLPLFISHYNIYYNSGNNIIKLKNFIHNGYIFSENDIYLENSIINGTIFSLKNIYLTNCKINNKVENENDLINYDSDLCDESSSESSKSFESLYDKLKDISLSPSPLFSECSSQNISPSISIKSSPPASPPLELQLHLTSLENKPIKSSICLYTFDFINFKSILSDNSILYFNSSGIDNIYIINIKNIFIYINIENSYNIKNKINKLKFINIIIREINEKTNENILIKNYLFSFNNNNNIEEEIKHNDLNIIKTTSDIKINLNNYNKLNKIFISSILKPININNINYINKSNKLIPIIVDYKYICILHNNKLNNNSLNNNELLFNSSENLSDGCYRLLQWSRGAVNVLINAGKITMLSMQSYYKDKRFNETWNWVNGVLLKSNIKIDKFNINDICLAITHDSTVIRIQSDDNNVYITFMCSNPDIKLEGIFIDIHNIKPFTMVKSGIKDYSYLGMRDFD
jgi:hypothetical protein